MLGIMTKEEAMAKAGELGMDLVMISETAAPPVVKIIDYGKFKYQAEKKEKDKKKGSKQVDMKEVKMSYKIDTHDYNVRVKNAISFLTKGARVKVMVEFKGRERQHVDLGRGLLDKVIEAAAEVAVADRVNMEGNRLGVILTPRKEGVS